MLRTVTAYVCVGRTMRDPTIPLTVGEWEEWGNPNEARFYDYIASYSPVDNVPQGQMALR
jgi:oligopeptidase B